MEVKEYFIFLAFGKIAIFFLQTFPPIRKIKWKFLQEMVECDLCLGFWVYTTLCFVYKVNIAPEYPIVSQVLTGAFSSLLIHLVSIGWKDKWSVFNFSDKEE